MWQSNGAPASLFLAIHQIPIPEKLCLRFFDCRRSAMRCDARTTADEDNDGPEPSQLGSGAAILVHAPNLTAIFNDRVIELIPRYGRSEAGRTKDERHFQRCRFLGWAWQA